ncbi:GGDEF domain-containing protein [Vibrio sp. T187]|uniref:GGDEF domain-containing protein n=1 Tax=Vibrio TaxID=662 RepID=UPI0010CA1213|nr:MULTISPECIES: GGDEF domain-containing protein [Vibrio]MBW3697285.1 GGDEF domain-containing protein [Vibrio sp. T187]
MFDMQREEWLSLMLSELPERLLVLDKNGRVVDSFGDAQSTCKNQTLNDLLPPAIAAQLQQQLDQAITNQSVQKVKYCISPHQQLQLSIEQLDAQADTELRWFESTFKPLAPRDGHTYTLWQERDITRDYLREAELKRLSETDELTGVLNRRAFMLGLEHQFKQASEQHFTCLMIDIDHFKEINDQVGHLSGDEVITQVANTCQTAIKACDYIGRLGGEEFGVVLTHTSAIQAYDVAEQIREAIEASPCTFDGHVIYPTVSIGIAETNPQVTSVKELLIQADKAMYYSKQTGRNQVTIYYPNLPDIKTEAQLKAKILRAS